MAVQADLCRSWLETLKTGFLVSRLKSVIGCLTSKIAISLPYPNHFLEYVGLHEFLGGSDKRLHNFLTSFQISVSLETSFKLSYIIEFSGHLLVGTFCLNCI